MFHEVVMLITFCIKGIPVTQYGSLDLVDSFMLFLDSTLLYFMVFLWFMSNDTKLPFKLC